MLSPITQEAISIIDAMPLTKHGPLEPLEYAKALPPEAEPLARVLSDEGTVELAEKYREADKTAVRAQQLYVWPSRIGYYAVFPSVFLAGVSVYVSTSNNPSLVEAVRPYLPWAQGLLLLVFLACAAMIYRSSSARPRWVRARAEAEAYRSCFFRQLMSASGNGDGGEARLRTLQLECFRRHLLDDQRQFSRSEFDAIAGLR